MTLLVINAILLIIEAFVLGAMGTVGLRTTMSMKNLYMVFAFLQLFVLHAFLDPSTMADLPGYCRVYQKMEYLSPFDKIPLVKMETGWMIMNKVLCMIWNNPRLLLIVTSLGIVGGYCIAIRKYSPMIGLSVLMFFFTSYPQSLFVLRQHLAVALCLLAIPAILKRNQLLFLLIVLLAISMHTTAVLFLPIYYIYGIQINRKFWLYFIIGLIVSTVLMQFVTAWIYANTWYGSYGNDVVSNFTPLAIASLTIFLYLYCSRWSVNGVEGKEKLFFIMGMMGVVLGIWGTLFSGFTSRLALYYTVSNVFLVPIAINKVPDQIQRVIISMLCIACFGALFYTTISSRYFTGYHLMF